MPARLLQSRPTAAPWTVAHQAPPSTGFSRQEHWSGLPFPSPGELPNAGIESVVLMSPALARRFFTTSVTRKAVSFLIHGGSSFCKCEESAFLLGECFPPAGREWCPDFNLVPSGADSCVNTSGFSRTTLPLPGCSLLLWRLWTSQVQNGAACDCAGHNDPGWSCVPFVDLGWRKVCVPCVQPSGTCQSGRDKLWPY